jgi:hypothetical protein
MLLDFWRALGIATGIFFTNWAVSSVVDPTGLFATVQINLLLLVAAAIIFAVFSYAYFHKGPKASARHGFELAAFFFLIFGALGVLAAILSPIDVPPVPYEMFIMIAQAAITLGVPTVVGKYLERN